MSQYTNNWITSQNNPELSILDKIKMLLSQPYKLVLVQQHELERLKLNNNRIKHLKYVNDLFEHYVLNKGKKTYTLA